METRRCVSILLIAAAVAGGCGQDVVSQARKQHRDFVGAEPTRADVVGTYVLSDQTVIPGGVSALGGRLCQLEVVADGTFIITNYPDYTGARPSSLKQYGTLYSTTGTWTLGTVGTSYGYGPDPKDCWGLRFSGSDKKVDPMAFTGSRAPYGLLMILGDPDSHNTIRFTKREHPSKPSTATGLPTGSHLED